MKLKIRIESLYFGLGFLSLFSALVILIIFLFKLSDYYTLSSTSKEIDIQDTGSVGDFIGGVIGSLLSFGSVIFIILTLLKQQEAIATQRQQFDIQQFENKFFQLLKVQQEIINAIEVRDTAISEAKMGGRDRSISGINSFEFMYKRLKQHYYKIQEISLPNKPIPFELKKFDSTEDEEQSNKMQDALERLSIHMEISDIQTLETPMKIAKAAYSTIYSSFHGQLSHYFRHLFHILNFINQSWYLQRSKNEEINQKTFEKYKDYVDLIQAQMSSYQLALLFYHGLYFNEFKKFMHIYNFLSNLCIQDIITEEHKDFYCETIIDGEKYKAIRLNDRKKLVETIN